LSDQGVLCGADLHQEWLLPWWWSSYRLNNTCPVTFCDFGLSDDARSWCQDRGTVISIDTCSSWIASCDQIPAFLKSEWEKLYGKRIWNSRQAWFKKPIALLDSPYQKTLWVDIDCEILSSIHPLFEFCSSSCPFALVREISTDYLPLFHPQVKYNGGVIVYMKEAGILKKWADAARSQNDQFWGDDPLLSHLICQYRYPIQEIPPIWNWRMSDGFNPLAHIYHWVGSGGKEYIRQWGGIKPSLDAFQKGGF